MEEEEVYKVQNVCCSGSVVSYMSRLNGMVSQETRIITEIKDVEIPSNFFSVKIRLLLQLLLTALFIVYFGLPSVDRFRMKRVRSIHNLMHKYMLCR